MEAATAAWHPYGWQPQFFSEIDNTASRFLAAKFPDVPNLGDMTKFKEWPDYELDLLVGGTPCQSFSVAGLRKGLLDPRGNLMLTFLGIADKYRPKWVVWENVPGVLSSSGGRDFGSFLGALAELGYGWAYRVLDAQHVRVDGFGRAVPQRRRRVFVVGCLGDWRGAAAVLFERESLLGHSPPRRQAGQGTAIGVEIDPSGGGFTDVNPTLDCRAKDGPIRNQLAGAVMVEPVSKCLNAGAMGRIDSESESESFVAHGLRASGFDASEDGTGRGTPLVPVVVSETLTSNGDAHSGFRDEKGLVPVAWSIMPQNSGKDYKARMVDVAQPIMAGGPVGGNQGGDYIQAAWAVRRLTPLECTRLQGFPDDYFDVPGKPFADGAKYKMLGNSMAVNVMSWVGQRIAIEDMME